MYASIHLYTYKFVLMYMYAVCMTFHVQVKWMNYLNGVTHINIFLCINLKFCYYGV